MSGSVIHPARSEGDPTDFSVTELSKFLSDAGFEDTIVKACRKAGMDGPCLTMIVEINDIACLLDLVPRMQAYKLMGHWKKIMKQVEQRQSATSSSHMKPQPPQSHQHVQLHRPHQPEPEPDRDPEPVPELEPDAESHQPQLSLDVTKEGASVNKPVQVHSGTKTEEKRPLHAGIDGSHEDQGAPTAIVEKAALGSMNQLQGKSSADDYLYGDEDNEATARPPKDPFALITRCSIGPVGSQVSMGLILSCCGFVVMQIGLLRVHSDTQHALANYFATQIWYCVLWPYTYWKFFRMAFPVCKGLTPLRRRIILGGTTLIYMIALLLVSFCWDPRSGGRWRMLRVVGIGLWCTNWSIMEICYPFSHMNAWASSLTPSQKRNEIMLVGFKIFHLMVHGVEYW